MDSSNIPKAGYYSVSIAYKSKEKSVPDAHYTVFHAGGKTDFVVNQTMGGGTWIYPRHVLFQSRS